MSSTQTQTQDELEAAAAFGAGPAQYGLSSELARLCLPSEFKDLHRKLAWVDSICLLFLLIGLVGLKEPKIVERPLTQRTDVVPVVIIPPEDQPKQEPEVKQDDTQPQETPMDTPQVAVVVAAADPSTVAFSVPVVGATAVTSARFATPPPPISQAPKFTKFDPNAYGSGRYPKPDYPGFAQRYNYQGTVTLEIRLTEDWQVESVKVFKSSGYPVLDEAAIKQVKNVWHFGPPLPGRLLLADFKFELQ